MEARQIGQRKGYLLKGTSSLKLPLLGTIQPLSIETHVYLRDNYVLDEARFDIEAPQYYFNGFLQRKKHNLYSLTLQTPGQIQTKEVQIEDQIIHSSLTPLSFSYIPRQKKMDLFLYDPFLNQHTRVTLENLGKDTIEVEGQPQEVSVIEMDVEGVKGKMFVDPKGQMLRQEFLGFVFLKEEATSLVKKDFLPKKEDLASFFSVPVPGLPPAEKLEYLKIEISGIPEEYIRQDFNQKVYPQGDAVIAEIRKIYTGESEKIPLEAEGLSQYLAEDEYIKFSSPQIQALVASIVGGEKDSLAILENLLHWIEKNIKKVPTFSMPSTSDVIAMKQGDCGELSALLVGFLRSLGIPSYVNIGLVQMGGSFFYHAWVSAYVGEWIDTDPALGQLIADPTHIKFFKGFENQFEIFKILGKLKARVLEYR
jgi:hypothetical protein